MGHPYQKIRNDGARECVVCRKAYDRNIQQKYREKRRLWEEKKKVEDPTYFSRMQRNLRKKNLNVLSF